MQQSEIDIVLVKSGTATIAEVEAISGDGQIVVASASAKLAPGDEYDDQIGYDLAVARALAKLSRRLVKRANGAVKQADMKRISSEQRKKRNG